MEEIGAFINRISVGVRLFGFYDPVGRCGGFSSFKGPFVQNRCGPEVGCGGSFCWAAVLWKESRCFFVRFAPPFEGNGVYKMRMTAIRGIDICGEEGYTYR